MKIIISPAKKMIDKSDLFLGKSNPEFLDEAEFLMKRLRAMNLHELKALWKCSDKLVSENAELIEAWETNRAVSPAIMSYVGIQYQYMAPHVLEEEALEYVERNLRILSGLYGVLKPFDRIMAYRLEMQSKFQDEPKSLYKFWGNKIYKSILNEETGRDKVILNLSSEEYARAVRPFVEEGCQFIDVFFGFPTGGGLKEKATYAKMGRGELVRFMAENKVESPKEIKEFNSLGYRYSEEHSTPNQIVFIGDEKSAAKWGKSKK